MKKFIIGLIIGIIIATSLTAFAVDNEILAKLSNFNFLVNGQAVELETQPLVVNGTTYLPVRELSNLLGYDVTYKADSRTIELNRPNKVNTPSLPVETVPEIKEQFFNINEEFELDGVHVRVNSFSFKVEPKCEVILDVDIKFDNIPKITRPSEFGKLSQPFTIKLFDMNDKEIITLIRQTPFDRNNLPSEGEWSNVLLGSAIRISNMNFTGFNYLIFENESKGIKVEIPN